MSQDQLIITEPNGVERTRPLGPRGLTIGREAENDLVIGYNLVSRRHASISFERGYYYVTDLNSANGTYLGENRLAPNQPTPWAPNQPLRIGEVVIHLQQVDQPASPLERPDEETRVGWTPEGLAPAPKKQGLNRTVLVVGLLLIFLCACAAVAAGAYYFLQ